MKTRNVGILIFTNAEVLDFAGPFEVFNVANEVLGEKAFRVFTIAEHKHTVCVRGGLKVTPLYTISEHPKLDLLVIPGGMGRITEMNNKAITGWVWKIFPELEMLLTVCTGVFIAGKAGVMNVKKATTHHSEYDEFVKSYPDIELVRNVKYVDNGKIVTSGGISAGINMSLYIVDKLLGNGMGKRTAGQMEYDM